MTTPKGSHHDFVADTVLKRDVFSQTIIGHLGADPDRKVVLRDLSAVPWYAWVLAQWLARREVRGLQAVQGIEGVPILLAADRKGILRVWSEGTPLHLAKPSDALWFTDAKRLLRDLRRRGVCHNDIAKPQNWLMLPDGRAGVIDFQLASVHRRQGLLFRIAAREDLRHMLKQKRAFAPDRLVPAERAMLAEKSVPSRIWMATGKRLYNFITRRLMDWSDGEGFEDQIELHGTAIRQSFADAGAVATGLASYSLSAGGVGVYAFVEGLSGDVPEMDHKVHLIQKVAALPRRPDGTVWEELLQLIANNRLDEVDQLLLDAPDQVAATKTIIKERLNLTDRRLR